MAPGMFASTLALTFAAAEALDPLIMLPLGVNMPLGSFLSTPVDGGPALAQSWSADVIQKNHLGDAHGNIFYDVARRRWRMRFCMSQTIFYPDGEACFDQLMKDIPGNKFNLSVGTGDDQICKEIPGAYYDVLQAPALANARLTGEKKVVDGVPCDVWFGSLNVPGKSFNVSSCVAADGVPREHNISSGLAYKAAASQVWVLSNVSLGEPAEGSFAPFQVCSNDYPKPPCASSEIAEIDVYRTRSKAEPNVLSNRNVGDALGDMGFFCGAGGMDETQVVTRWEVQANASWGQYAYCLYAGGKNKCLGNTGKQVGRESSEGLGRGAVQGQCTPNEDVGSWFSFPAEGECAPGAPVGHNGCTWSAVPVRTVSSACILNDRGLKKVCEEEYGHAPLLRSAAIFRAALASADPAEGGCPDVEDESFNLVVV
eukprot:TRINITY_DN29923_c0_g1_i1.p1 TRINITY_DN29923_c0_g1~~TRINITY_DN29923_c0_g1_i1.p1  ORF type:complete len:457 (+),score=66.32 TRINITY_DN29923_c0_g1_i1:92-1372(+)